MLIKIFENIISDDRLMIADEKLANSSALSSSLSNKTSSSRKYKNANTATKTYYSSFLFDQYEEEINDSSSDTPIDSSIDSSADQPTDTPNDPAVYPTLPNAEPIDASLGDLNNPTIGDEYIEHIAGLANELSNNTIDMINGSGGSVDIIVSIDGNEFIAAETTDNNIKINSSYEIDSSINTTEKEPVSKEELEQIKRNAAKRQLNASFTPAAVKSGLITNDEYTTAENKDVTHLINKDEHFFVGFTNNTLQAQIISKWLQIICDKYGANEEDIEMEVTSPWKNDKMYLNYVFKIPGLHTSDKVLPLEFLKYDDYQMSYRVSIKAISELYTPVTYVILYKNYPDVDHAKDMTDIITYYNSYAHTIQGSSGTYKDRKGKIIKLEAGDTTTQDFSVEYGSAILCMADGCNSYFFYGLGKGPKDKGLNAIVFLTATKDIRARDNVIRMSSAYATASIFELKESEEQVSRQEKLNSFNENIYNIYYNAVSTTLDSIKEFCTSDTYKIYRPDTSNPTSDDNIAKFQYCSMIGDTAIPSNIYGNMLDAYKDLYKNKDFQTANSLWTKISSAYAKIQSIHNNSEFNKYISEAAADLTISLDDAKQHLVALWRSQAVVTYSMPESICTSNSSDVDLLSDSDIYWFCESPWYADFDYLWGAFIDENVTEDIYVPHLIGARGEAKDGRISGSISIYNVSYNIVDGLLTGNSENSAINYLTQSFDAIKQGLTNRLTEINDEWQNELNHQNQINERRDTLSSHATNFYNYTNTIFGSIGDYAFEVKNKTIGTIENKPEGFDEYAAIVDADYANLSISAYATKLNQYAIQYKNRINIPSTLGYITDSELENDDTYNAHLTSLTSGLSHSQAFFTIICTLQEEYNNMTPADPDGKEEIDPSVPGDQTEPPGEEQPDSSTSEEETTTTTTSQLPFSSLDIGDPDILGYNNMQSMILGAYQETAVDNELFSYMEEGPGSGGSGGGGATNVTTTTTSAPTTTTTTTKRTTAAPVIITSTHSADDGINTIDIGGTLGEKFVMKEEPNAFYIRVESLNEVGTRLLNMGRLAISLDYFDISGNKRNHKSRNGYQAKRKDNGQYAIEKKKQSRLRASRGVWKKITCDTDKNTEAIPVIDTQCAYTNNPNNKFSIVSDCIPYKQGDWLILYLDQSNFALNKQFKYAQRAILNNAKYIIDPSVGLVKDTANIPDASYSDSTGSLQQRTGLITYKIRAMLRDVNNDHHSISALKCIYDTYTFSRRYFYKGINNRYVNGNGTINTLNSLNDTSNNDYKLSSSINPLNIYNRNVNVRGYCFVVVSSSGDPSNPLELGEGCIYLNDKEIVSSEINNNQYSLYSLPVKYSMYPRPRNKVVSLTQNNVKQEQKENEWDHKKPVQTILKSSTTKEQWSYNEYYYEPNFIMPTAETPPMHYLSSDHNDIVVRREVDEETNTVDAVTTVREHRIAAYNFYCKKPKTSPQVLVRDLNIYDGYFCGFPSVPAKFGDSNIDKSNYELLEPGQKTFCIDYPKMYKPTPNKNTIYLGNLEFLGISTKHISPTDILEAVNTSTVDSLDFNIKCLYYTTTDKFSTNDVCTYNTNDTSHSLQRQIFSLTFDDTSIENVSDKTNIVYIYLLHTTSKIDE